MAATYSTRRATLADLDEVTEVVLAAMPHEPHWNYRFVHKDEFPDDHRKLTRLLYEQFISPANDDWHVMVAEVSLPDHEGSAKVVAFAVWDVSFVNMAKLGPSYVPQNRTPGYDPR